MKRVLVICCLGLLPASGWAAQFMSPHPKTAGDLAELCGAQPGGTAADSKINYCHGFAQGAVEVWRAEGRDKGKFCIPNPAPSRATTLGEFVGWARSLPAHREMLVLSGLFKFFEERFPCKS